MEITQIVNSLQAAFNEQLKDGEERKIIFWTDVNEHFINDFQQVEIENVKVIQMDENNQLFVKHLLEEEDRTSNYLIYTTIDLEDRDNWLYDTVLYSKVFYADRISLLMNELNIDQPLRPIIEKYATFFNSQERTRRFKSFNVKNHTKETIELAMMNAICKTMSLSVEAVLRTVLTDTLDDENNRYLYEMERFFDINTFWSYVERDYSYEAETKSLKSLFYQLVVTAFSQSVAEEHLTAVERFIGRGNKPNAIVFIDHWLNHKTDYTVFYEYIKEAEADLGIADILNVLPVEQFSEATIFPYVDQAIIIYIANSLMNEQEDYEEFIELIELRRTKHFYEMFKNTYEALYYTVKMFQFKKQFPYGLPQGEAKRLYDSYINDFYIMDTYYRKFYVAFDAAESSELLFKLKETVEYLYTNWFIAELNMHWSQAINGSVAENWSLPSVFSQRNFYPTFIHPHVEKNERAFVIISDALRYEIGYELHEILNREITGECELQTMLSVVPSVTKLGMAALLPHKKLTIDNKGNVKVNEMSTSGLANRQKVLENYSDDSIAIHAKDIFTMNQAERKETFKGKRLIYIYHDTIDATGDNAKTEINTFRATEQAVEELSDLLRIIRNDLSGTFVYVTADHGFLYERDELAASDLIKKQTDEAIESSRRYILTTDEISGDGQLTINMAKVVDNEQPLYAHIPNATIRYRIQGAGSRFVHGGTSLQEVVVPLLKIRNRRAGQRGAQNAEKTNIKLTSTTRRITNTIFNLNFFQTERIEEKTIPRTVVIHIANENGVVLSNEETIIGDRTSSDPAERTFNIQFVLKNNDYDRNEQYYLIIKDTETDVVTEKIPFTIVV